MPKRFILIILLGTLFGCTSLPANKVRLTGLQTPHRLYVTDATLPDNDPSFLTGEGNILNCRYGIHHLTPKEFDPPKASIFGALLAEAYPEIVDHSVILERFDVYKNQNLTSHRSAGIAMGGAVGSAIAANARKNQGLTTAAAFTITMSPQPILSETTVGCPNKQEGEYDRAEVNSGNDAIITWLKFRVDGKPYTVRTLYQFKTSNRLGTAEALSGAIRKTILETGKALLAEQHGS